MQILKFRNFENNKLFRNKAILSLNNAVGEVIIILRENTMLQLQIQSQMNDTRFAVMYRTSVEEKSYNLNR